MDLDTILKAAIEMGASDIHLVSGHVPMARIRTVMTQLDYPVITPEGVMRMLKHVTRENHIAIFEKVKDVDFSYRRSRSRACALLGGGFP